MSATSINTPGTHTGLLLDPLSTGNSNLLSHLYHWLTSSQWMTIKGIFVEGVDSRLARSVIIINCKQLLFCILRFPFTVIWPFLFHDTHAFIVFQVYFNIILNILKMLHNFKEWRHINNPTVGTSRVTCKYTTGKKKQRQDTIIKYYITQTCINKCLREPKCDNKHQKFR